MKLSATLADGTQVRRREAGGFIFTHSIYIPALRMPSHAHEAATLGVVLAGAYTETLDGKSLTRVPSTIVVRPPGETHAVQFHRRPVRILNMEINRTALERLCVFSLRLSRPVDFRDTQLNWLAARLLREFQIDDEASVLALEGLALELLAEVLRQGGQRAESRAPRWLKETRDLLHARFAEKLTLEEVAGAVGVHPVHLARVFRRQFGCTVGEYVRCLRVECAGRQLSASDAPLHQVAAVAGFADQSHLTRTFKQHTGQTPAQYRRTSRRR